MTRQEFLDQVLSPLGRLTAEERENVRRELEEHVEDRMEALLDMGWDEALAESRCLEAMGDAVEIGREMARQYRGRGWLWIGRAAVVLTVVVCIQALLGIGVLFNAWDGLVVRTLRPQITSMLDEVEAEAQVDLRMDIGSDVLRVVRVSVGEVEDQHVAEIAMCAYDRWPFGIVAHNCENWITVEGLEDDVRIHGGPASRTYGAECWQMYAVPAPEDRSVVLTYSRYGETASLEVPLPEQGGTV